MANRIKKSEYQNYADCIRSDQVSAPEIVELFEDKAFYKWYKKKEEERIKRENEPKVHHYGDDTV